MVNADKVKRKLPSLLVEGSATKKKGWNILMRYRFEGGCWDLSANCIDSGSCFCVLSTVVSKDVRVKRMFFLILDVTSLGTLEAASRTGENCENTRRPAEITAPMILMALIWRFINI